MGPETAGVPRLVALIHAGMDVARLNFSHGDYGGHRQMFDDIREASKHCGRPIAILADLCGPKIRVGNMKNDALELKKDQEVFLVPETPANKGMEGADGKIPHSYLPLARDVKAGERILLDDGLLELEVTGKQGEEVRCRVVVDGVLKTHKGMNLPGSSLSTPALTEKDKADIVFGCGLGVDYFALSFVRSAEDLHEAKRLAGEIPVIAKIEKPEAVEKLDAILDAADGAMVARGDLGVEAGQEKVPLIQKRIIHDIKLRAKPVITATQMLDSMIQNPRPTRAEVSDVANAVLDGTDAVMLSAETSVGKYPVEAVKTLHSIISEVEGSDYLSELNEKQSHSLENTFSNAVADAIVHMGVRLQLSAFAVYTESGRSAALVSAHRPKANIVSFSRHDSVLRRLSLYWGVKPLHGDWVHGVSGVVEQAEKELLRHQLVQPGDDIAITFGMVIGNEPFQTNMIKLWKVRK